ncbi:hypothetical protein PR048_008597 [Dryococelus australis]|uniref:Uncharacterized protein n=1 Tax=Dryococelus australis TaxID=614101 RepID=A0ABQ9HZB6_9NEOP|nr:hypothetical protein PR048_008597 [Dryococelus australis]
MDQRSDIPSGNCSNQLGGGVGIVLWCVAGDRDPAPLFINPEVQKLLKQLTRIDVRKVFKKRKDEQKLAPPEYRFLTDDQLKQVMKEASEKVDQKLQMPPVVKKYDEGDVVISQDPELKGYCEATFIFTDISYAFSPVSDRLVVVRDTDGTLRKASCEQRSRMNQLYFPMPGRQMHMPRMFQDEYLQPLLEQGRYEFVLDRACIQLEPDNPEFQRITSATYNHVDEYRKYDALRSTRHFGPLAFHLAWHHRIDNLLLEIIQTGRLIDVLGLLRDRHGEHPVVYNMQHCKYKDSIVRENAWKVIASSLNKKADPEFASPGCIDMLLAADVVADVMTGRKIEGKSHAFHTAFGWVVTGNAPCASKGVLEGRRGPSVKFLLREAQQCENHFISTHKCGEDGRFVLRLPFRSSTCNLGNSSSRAVRRLGGLECRLAKMSELKHYYQDFMEEYENFGHMTCIGQLTPTRDGYQVSLTTNGMSQLEKRYQECGHVLRTLCHPCLKLIVKFMRGSIQRNLIAQRPVTAGVRGS